MTEAGKRLLERESLNSRSFALITPEAIATIEAEATAAAEQRLAGLREALRGLVDAHRLGREHRPCICAAHENARRALLDPAPELVARTEEMLAALSPPASPRQGEPEPDERFVRLAGAVMQVREFLALHRKATGRSDVNIRKVITLLNQALTDEGNEP